MLHPPAEDALSSSSSAIFGQKAFGNYNGLVTGLVYTPVPPQLPSHGHAPLQPGAAPPPWLAIVLDTRMQPSSLQNAKQGIAQAIMALPPHTRLLLAVVDKVVSFIDLRSASAPAWVLHSATSKASVALPHLVRAADIRATPLSHCIPNLPAILSTIRHYPQPCTPQLHLHSIVSALDIAIYLLTASMAAWDANQRSKAAPAHSYSPGEAPQPSSSSSAGQLAPIHAARVIFITDQPPPPTTPAAAADAATPLEPKQQAHLRQLMSALGAKADTVDVPIDVVTGSPAAPSWLPLQDTVIASRGTTVYQPHLAPPLASNLAALATKRVGWDGAIGFSLPPEVKVAELQGPIAPSQPLPHFQPDTPPGSGHPSSSSSSGVPVSLPASTRSPVKPAAADAAAASGGGTGGGSKSNTPRAGWPDNAAAVPAMEAGSCFLLQLELARDLPPDSSLQIEAVAQWSNCYGQRQQQVSKLQLAVAARRSQFLPSLHQQSALLLLARQLVAATHATYQKAAGKALPARRRVREEAQLRVGMQLALMAQRLGDAHTVRRGILGFGSQQVWQLPDELVPMAVALYLLQQGPLLGSRPPVLFQRRATPGSPSAVAPAPSAMATAAGGAPSADVLAATAGLSLEEDEEALEAAWQLQVYQLLDASPAVGVRLAAPELHVYDPKTAGFHHVLPVTLAITPGGLAVLDCGTQLLVYAGAVLPQDTPSRSLEEGATAAAGGSVGGGQQASGAAAAAAGGAALVPDVAMVAAPAVQLAQQLSKGRLPVPSIHVLETEEELDQLLSLLVPLHLDPMPCQLLLLPSLKSQPAAQHGQLLQWHKQLHDRRVMGDGTAALAQPPTLSEWCDSLRIGLPDCGGTAQGQE